MHDYNKVVQGDSAYTKGTLDGACARGADVRSTAARLGLSNVHISTHASKLTIWKGGGLIKVTRPGYRESPECEHSKRGEVETMSRASRRRLMYKLGMIERQVVPWFVALTYPGRFDGDARSCKRDLNKFNNRLKRIGAAAVWRLEYQVRKTGASEGESVPHFHLLIWRHDDMTLDEFHHWLSRTWFEVVGSGSLDHLAAGTRCELMRSWRGVMSYAAKYICKEDVSAVPEGCGRMWGILNRKLIPWAEAETITISASQCVVAFEFFEGAAGPIWREECPSRMLLIDSPEHARTNILQLAELRAARIR